MMMVYRLYDDYRPLIIKAALGRRLWSSFLFTCVFFLCPFFLLFLTSWHSSSLFFTDTFTVVACLFRGAYFSACDTSHFFLVLCLGDSLGKVLPSVQFLSFTSISAFSSPRIPVRESNKIMSDIALSSNSLMFFLNHDL